MKDDIPTQTTAFDNDASDNPPTNEALSDALADSVGEPDAQSKDCRDHCMHCGMHCIYLKKIYKEGEK